MNVYREDTFKCADVPSDGIAVCMTGYGDGVVVWYPTNATKTVHLDADTAIAMATRIIAIAMELKEPLDG